VNAGCAKAQAALDDAKCEHDQRAATLNEERDALEKKSQAEDERWALEKKKLESAPRRARD
jgi:colicin import membrane protein